MFKLLDEKQYFNFPKVGDLVKGKVLSAGTDGIYLDLNGIATGVVRGRERYDEAEEYKNLKAGDEVEATVLELENENGDVELSFQYASRQRSWQTLKDFERSNEIISAVISEANKGGLIIKIGNVLGFLPVSQLSPEHYPRVPGGDKNRILEILKSYVGQKLEVKVLDVNEGDDKLIVSEKAAWEETKKDVLNKYHTGMTVDGIVTAVTDFGIFVEFDDKIEGLIHISEIAWQRIDNPHDFVKVGQKIKAEIISVENSKIFLSLKKMAPDPWDGIEKKYGLGQKITGEVIKVNPFGLFVELEKNIQGLAHISQLSDKTVTDINEVAKAGDKLDFYIVSLDPKNHRLGLSLVKPKTETPSNEKKEKTAGEKAEEKTTEPKKNEENPEVDVIPESAPADIRPASPARFAESRRVGGDPATAEIKEPEIATAENPTEVEDKKEVKKKEPDEKKPATKKTPAKNNKKTAKKKE